MSAHVHFPTLSYPRPTTRASVRDKCPRDQQRDYLRYPSSPSKTQFWLYLSRERDRTLADTCATTASKPVRQAAGAGAREPARPRADARGRAGGGGSSLYESTVLCEYLEERYAGHEPNILPPYSSYYYYYYSGSGSGSGPGSSPAAAAADGDSDYYRARHRICADFVGTRVIPAFHRFLQFQPAGDDDDDDDDDEQPRAEAETGDGLDVMRTEFRNTLREFARELLRNDEEEGRGGEETEGRRERAAPSSWGTASGSRISRSCPGRWVSFFLSSSFYFGL